MTAQTDAKLADLRASSGEDEAVIVRRCIMAFGSGMTEDRAFRIRGRLNEITMNAALLARKCPVAEIQSIIKEIDTAAKAIAKEVA